MSVLVECLLRSHFSTAMLFNVPVPNYLDNTLQAGWDSSVGRVSAGALGREVLGSNPTSASYPGGDIGWSLQW